MNGPVDKSGNRSTPPGGEPEPTLLERSDLTRAEKLQKLRELEAELPDPSVAPAAESSADQGTQVHMFVTDNPGRADEVDPALLIIDQPDAVLPPHPLGLEWRYFATTTTQDQLLARWREEAEVNLARQGFFVFGKGAS